MGFYGILWEFRGISWENHWKNMGKNMGKSMKIMGKISSRCFFPAMFDNMEGYISTDIGILQQKWGSYGEIFWCFTVLGYTLGNHRNTVDVWKPYKYGINQLSTGAGLYHLQQIWMSMSKTYWKIPQKLLVFIQKGFPAHSWWSLIYKG